jgi:hypothetical protein
MSARAPASPKVVLVAQPPAQPRSGIAVERPIRLADRAYSEVVRPAEQRAIQSAHQLRGALLRHRDCRQRMDLLNQAPDALLRHISGAIG